MKMLEYKNNEKELNNLSRNINIQNKGTIVIVSTSDLHFGAINPKTEYDILCEQMLNKLENIHFDIFTINGDIFDSKFMSNSDVVMYASMFIDKVVSLCRRKRATFFIIAGTELHDAGQIKLFYHYLQDPTIDIRIVEDCRFEYTKNAKILCIPELYGKGEDYYKPLLFSQRYDCVFMHGAFTGAIFNLNPKGLDSDREVTFKFSDFCQCESLMLSGHVHTPGVFGNGYFYYSGTPIRYKFGEEEPKGFLISAVNLDTHEHYTEFQEIKSFRYDTVNVDNLLMSDPQTIVNYVNELKSQGIDYIRLEFTKVNENNVANYNIINNYYKNSRSVKIKCNYSEKQKIIEQNDQTDEIYKQYDYILDDSLSPEQIFVKYVNQQKGFEYINVDDLMEILNDL